MTSALRKCKENITLSFFHYLNAKYVSFGDPSLKIHTNFSHNNDQTAGAPLP